MRLIRNILLLTLSGCGSQHVLDVSDSEQNITQRGESYSYVVVRLEFIQQIKDLCTDLNRNEDPVERKAEIAQCTFDRMSLLNFNFGSILDTQQEICQLDPAQLTPEQLQVYLTICNL